MVGSGRRLSMGFSFIAGALLSAHLPDQPWRPLISRTAYCVGFFNCDSRPSAVVHGKYFDGDPALPLAQRDEGTDTSIAADERLLCLRLAFVARDKSRS